VGRLLTKATVEYGPGFGFGGARILDVAKQIITPLDFDVTITSSRDGEHSGPDDPHHSGNAFDFRTHDLIGARKTLWLSKLRTRLGDRFTILLENEGLPNEHCHVQPRKGTVYTALDYLRDA
jgi:hypothetical protein